MVDEICVEIGKIDRLKKVVYFKFFLHFKTLFRYLTNVRFVYVLIFLH